jgi:predicted dehydrogenase
MSQDFNKGINRRDFLKMSGQGMIGLGLSSSLISWPTWAQEQKTQVVGSTNRTTLLDRLKPQSSFPYQEEDSLPQDKRIGYAIVGLGKLSQEELLPAFTHCKKSRLVALVSGDRNKATKLAERYNVSPKNIYNYQNYDQLMDNPAVQVVYIVLPNHLHAEYTIRAAQAGKHVLCEKPMANSVAECQAMIDACNQANRKLMIAYRLQYEPHHRRAIEMARQQEFGTLKHIVTENCENNLKDPNHWRFDKARGGGGALPDIGIYCLNAARYLTGEEPIEISAHKYSTPTDARFKTVDESVNFYLKFPSGVTASCLTSYGCFSGKRFRAYAENGWFEIDPAFSYKGLRLMSSSTVDKETDQTEHQCRIVNHFANEMDEMSTCILENKPPLMPGEEGMQDMRLIELIYKSAESGQLITIPSVKTLDTFRGIAKSKG